MERVSITPRPGWQGIVEEQGLAYYMTDERPYWDESAFYRFSRAEIDAIEAATYALDKMCLEVVEYVIQNNRWGDFLIPPAFVPLVVESWERDERTIYGRFDLACDGENIKLLEYNADTPTALIEAAVIQWYWYRDIAQNNTALDQFNSLHERLIEAWQAVRAEGVTQVHFASIPDYDDEGEDFLNTGYLQDTAKQAGLSTEYLSIAEIGWNPRRGFVDLHDAPIACCFKLYPWEWLLREPFASHLLSSKTRWLEAPWKMLLSNKALLPMLHRLFPNSPYLLPADFTPLSGSYVRKPILGREGANTQIVENGTVTLETGGKYSGPSIYQQYFPLTNFGHGFPIVGSWMVNGWAAGIGIREDDSRITGNLCRFLPHLFD